MPNVGRPRQLTLVGASLVESGAAIGQSALELSAARLHPKQMNRMLGECAPVRRIAEALRESLD